MKLREIQQAARQLGLSELARRTGIARSYLYRVLDGSSVPTIDVLEEITEALGYEVEIKKAPPQDSARWASMKTSKDGRWKIHFFNFVDAFRRDRSFTLIKDAPVDELDVKYKALLAATVWALCDEIGVAPPAWAILQPPLKEPWFVAGIENLKALSIVESPAFFKQKNVFVLENFLSRA